MTRPFVFVVAVLLAPAAAQAQAVDSQRIAEAQSLAEQAVRAMESKDYASACPKLEEATRLVPAAIGAQETLAECYIGSGRLASAWAQYGRMEAEARRSGQTERANGAAAKAAALKPRLATLTLHVGQPARELPNLTISRRGMNYDAPMWGVPLPMDKGKHVFDVKAPGYELRSVETLIADDGTHLDVEIPMLSAENADKPDVRSPAPRSWQKPLGIAMTVAGGLGFGASGLLAGLAVGKKNESNEGGFCNAQNKCTNAGLDIRAQAVGLGNGATAAIIVGGVLAGSGLVLIMTAPSRKETPKNAGMMQWSLEIAPNRIGVQGVW